jgi:hypothetical protein
MEHASCVVIREHCATPREVAFEILPVCAVDFRSPLRPSSILESATHLDSQVDRKELTRRLAKLRGEPGFAGDAPGAPRRWSTERSAEWVPVKSELVVEVCYDHAIGDRFRHGTRPLRCRPDKRRTNARFEQLQREARPARLLKKLLTPLATTSRKKKR